ncbi:MAG: IS30 family transposase [Candidatus Pacebacteria bacterium]|nr:IS30 family transposase [Candidatus Paceibacterota bacterium]
MYFAHPHHPWERGTNEPTNGLIRRYYPKGQKFATLTSEDIAKVVWRLNHRPRKILHSRTPVRSVRGVLQFGFKLKLSPIPLENNRMIEPCGMKRVRAIL